jgi:ABC-type Zn uptake system ZnuABC Zn-binding protein ZnuA
MLHLLLALALQQQEPLDIVVTIPDLGDLVRTIGGDTMNVVVMVPPGADPHAVLPKASLLLKLQRADALVCMGLDFEHAFLPALLEKVNNERIQPGQPGWCCVADGITPLDVPASLDRAQGADLHPRGNPHFNLDPENGRIMAVAVRDLLVRVDPARAQEYHARWLAWDDDARQRIARWTKRLEPLRGKAIVTYHRSWTYFAARFNLRIAGEVEPKPGLPPSAAHLVELKRTIVTEEVRVLLMEPWYSERNLGKLLGGTEVHLVQAGTCCGEGQHYLDFLGSIVEQVALAHGLPPPPEE